MKTAEKIVRKWGVSKAGAVVTCHICETENNADQAIYDLNRDKVKDTSGIHCTKCGTLITVVITFMGARSLEQLLIERSKPIVETHYGKVS